MEPKTFIIHHLVKSEDLNHHGTLYAGRSAEWFVESGFVSAASLTKPKNILCLKIHGLTFSRPVPPGTIVRFESKVILAGRTSLVSAVKMTIAEGDEVVKGFITFIHVDDNGKPTPHGIEITPITPDDQALQEEAKKL